MAAGALARHELALDLTGADSSDGTDTVAAETVAEPVPQRPRGRRREVVIYAHLSAADLAKRAGPGGVGLVRVENTRSFVLVDQVKGWCADTGTQVTVKPVLDLNDGAGTGAYEAPGRLRELVVLTDGTCVWPWCTRSARRCDLDHRIPHTRGGSTCACNLAPLCRRHHRGKTHTPWTYQALGRGVYVWTSPHGRRYLRDTSGTRELIAGTCPHSTTSGAGSGNGTGADPPER